jgi:cell division septation protein DedD
MRPDDDGAEAPRELRLEGALLGVAGGVLIALLFGAFQLGRMVERGSAPAPASGGASDAASGERETAEAAEKVTFFDTLSGSGKEAEPSRQVGSKPEATAPPPTPVSAGPWFVQVFVGRDRQAAEDVVRELRQKQYPVRIDAVAEGASGSLFKVRVGGYPTKEAADSGADRLHADGHSGTWVVRVGS